MNRAVSKALADCIAEMERGAPIEECLKRHPSHVGELRPRLEAWQAMAAGEPVQPSTAAFERGRRAMLNGLESAPVRSGPLAAARLAPAGATVAAAAPPFFFFINRAGRGSPTPGRPRPPGGVPSGGGGSRQRD